MAVEPTLLRFIQLTDIHLDPYYVPNSAPSPSYCHQELSSRKSKPGPSRNSAYFGYPNSPCDSPVQLMNSTLQFMVDSGMADSLDVIFMTGDYTRHDRDNNLPVKKGEPTEQNENVVSFLTSAFNTSRVQVVPAIGNWDVWPHNSLKAGPNDVLDGLYEIWKPFLKGSSKAEKKDIAASFKRGGYHHRELVPGALDVIATNSLYWYSDNPEIPDCVPLSRSLSDYALKKSKEPGDVELQWLVTKLTHIREAGKKVMIVGHIAPTDASGEPSYRKNCYEWYSQISGEFSDVILGQLFGHINQDILTVLVKSAWQRPKAESQYRFMPITSSVLFQERYAFPQWNIVGFYHTSPSIVPVFNPGFRAGSLAITNDGTNQSFIQHYAQYHLDLEAANRQWDREHADPPPRKKPGKARFQNDSEPFQYQVDCHSLEDFGMQRMDPQSVGRLLARMGSSSTKSSTLIRQYKACMTIHSNQVDLIIDETTLFWIMAGVALSFVMGVVGFHLQMRRQRVSSGERDPLLS
ncbi:Metallo-dependent phosphatase-like protein [Polychytrium aggregatum]|uniref:Metallo-dependent phosphatase-like protein n=1 Tax=Polychytrium aggregatum TaxID=110093 RepID=UPI0022FDB6AD|nr:Metallo-dependent phosphatase-like protein [Polychytrium aggregatum]KAI9207595.1 Metallo-dependent phosphatase-like protein [Polychytrium aggregatum]